MNDSEFGTLAGLLAKIAYELQGKDWVDDPLRELLLEVWRKFDYYNHIREGR